MEGYWRVAEAFETQDEPAFCGLGTLVTALNALEVDPGAVWKGAWRWYHEAMLDCCVDLEEIKDHGIDFDSWVCLARCQGLDVVAQRADEHVTESQFRELVRTDCSAGDDQIGRVLCVSYSRRPLGQTGDGHFSPIGGYHEAEDLVLVMDVARFKHPPHWMPLPVLWQAMQACDQRTGLPRGFATLSRCFDRWAQPTIIQLTFGRGRLADTRAFFVSDVLPLVAGADGAADELWRALRSLPASVASLLYVHESYPPAVRPAIVLPALGSSSDVDSGNRLDESELPRTLLGSAEGALNELRTTPLYKTLRRASDDFRRRTGPLPLSLEAAAALLLVLASVQGSCLGDAAALRRALPLSSALIDASASAIAGPLLRDVGMAARQIAEMADVKAGSYGCCQTAGCGGNVDCGRRGSGCLS
eukprot:scaffold25881_cov129-Isochrysis_galbana.AAC.2